MGGPPSQTQCHSYHLNNDPQFQNKPHRATRLGLLYKIRYSDFTFDKLAGPTLSHFRHFGPLLDTKGSLWDEKVDLFGNLSSPFDPPTSITYPTVSLSTPDTPFLPLGGGHATLPGIKKRHRDLGVFCPPKPTQCHSHHLNNGPQFQNKPHRETRLGLLYKIATQISLLTNSRANFVAFRHLTTFGHKGVLMG